MALNQAESQVLAPGEIHIWPLDADSPAGLAYTAAACGLLSATERRRAAAITRTPTRNTYVAARAHLRTVLARYTAIAPAELLLTQEGASKPTLSNTAGAPAFNVSHTGAQIVVAVGAAPAVGVDIEPVAHADRVLRVARATFTEKEVGTLDMLGAAAGIHALMLWCFKESAVKARGGTVWEGLSGVSVCLDGTKAALVGDSGLCLIGGRLNANHVLALAVAVQDETSPALRCFGTDGAPDCAAFVPQFY